MNFQLELPTSEFEARLDQRAGLLEQALEAKVNELTGRLYAEIDANLSGGVLQERTGNLANSVMQTAAAWAGAVCGATVGISDEAPAFQYGIVHEMGGLGYYNIFPKEALALAFEVTGGQGSQPWGGMFTQPGGPDFIMTKRVVHPPAEKRPFIAPAVEIIRAVMFDELYGVISDALSG